MLRPLLIALQFLTRLPLPAGLFKKIEYTPRQLGQSVLFYPLAGLVIGGLLYLLVYLIKSFLPQLSSLIIAALVLLSWVLLSGGLHLDGLSDSADAWLGGYGDRDKTLAIMKDPYCGPAGVSVIVILLILKFALLVTIVEQSVLMLMISPVIARTSILLLFMTTTYVRADGIGASHAKHLPARWAWLIILIIIASSVYLLQLQALWLWLACAVIFFLLRALMIKRLGGTTGDTAGAMIEILETVILLVMAIQL